MTRGLRYWLSVFVLFGIGAGLAWLALALHPLRYSAEAELVAHPALTSAEVEALPAQAVQILRGGPVTGAVAAQIGLVAAHPVAQQVTLAAEPGGGTVYVVGHARSPAAAADLANTAADAFVTSGQSRWTLHTAATPADATSFEVPVPPRVARWRQSVSVAAATSLGVSMGLLAAPWLLPKRRAD
jgi:hypothetical protein